MPSAFHIHPWPEPKYHTFLSHAAEDRDRLVEPVRQELLSRNVTPWFDQTEYPSGMEPIYTLQESLLKCLHVVYFVTSSNVNQGRGWSSAERTLSSRIESHLSSGPDTLHNFQLALFFTPHAHVQTMRSIWDPLRKNGITTSYQVGSKQSIMWAADEITKFLTEQYQHRMETLIKLSKNSALQSYVHQYQGLYEWLQAPLVLPI